MTTAKWILVAVYSLMWICLSNARPIEDTIYDCDNTPWRSKGLCMNIQKCDQYLSLLEKQPMTEGVHRILTGANCGYEGLIPKVCCGTQNVRSINSKTSITKTVIDKELPMTTTTTTPPPTLVPVVDHPNRRLLAEDLCGPIPNDRITGGSDTSIHEFPWMALLGYNVGTKAPQFRCGGSLINKHYVLTAAHCVTLLAQDMKLVSVRIGDYDLRNERDCDVVDENGVGINCAEYQQFDIDKVHVHPDYSKRRLHNDIALVRLKGEADMTPLNVRPICLPLGRAAVLKAREVTVTGWGSTESGVRSEKLLKVTLPIVTIEKCSKAYKTYGTQIEVWQKHICAGGENLKDSCSGDSGGPLQAEGFYNGETRIVQYGIVSFGHHRCGTEGLPGGYTSVAYYVHWILDQLTD